MWWRMMWGELTFCWRFARPPPSSARTPSMSSAVSDDSPRPCARPLPWPTAAEMRCDVRGAGRWCWAAAGDPSASDSPSPPHSAPPALLWPHPAASLPGFISSDEGGTGSEDEGGGGGAEAGGEEAGRPAPCTHRHSFRASASLVGFLETHCICTRGGRVAEGQGWWERGGVEKGYPCMTESSCHPQ